MKATGIIRRVDDLGRVVIPKEIRRNLGIREGDPLEIFTDGKAVCFQKYSLLAEYVSTAKTLIDTLRKQGVKCALYDNSDCKICGDKNAPTEVEYEAYNPNHFAITVDGDFCGFLVIEDMNANDEPLIKFTAMALGKIMTVD